jgi:hypothetical protein
MLQYMESPHNILAGNLSRLHCLVTPAQIVEGKKLVEPAEASNEEEDKAYFLNHEYMFKQPFEPPIEARTSFYVGILDQKATRLGRLLDSGW